MKRQLLLLFIAFITSSFAFGQLNENFDGGTFPPTDWTLESGSGDWDQSNEIDDHTTGTGNFARYDCYNILGSTSAGLITPALDVTSGDQTFEFYANYYLISGAYGSTAELYVDVSDDNGSTWTSGSTNFISGQEDYGWFFVSIDLGNYEGQNFVGSVVKVRFSAISDYGSYDIGVDDVTGPALYVAACPDPSAQTVSTITTMGADLGWTDIYGSHWDLYIVATGDPAPDAGSTPTVNDITDNPYTWTGGTTNTTYDWYVRSDCGQDNSNVSDWTGPNTFTTDCDANTTFPWTEDFEGTFLPDCWSKIVHTGNDITQDSDQNHTAGGAYSLQFSSYDNSSDYNQYLFTQKQTISASYTQLSFWYRKYDTSSEVFEWGISTTTNPNDYTWTAVTLSDTYWQQTLVDLSAYVGQDVYIGFHYYGDYLYYVYLDDVSIDVTPTCPAPTDQTESNITITSADLGWTENGSATTWNIEFGPSGFTQGSGTMITGTTTNPHSLSGLSSGTTYDWYVQADCGGGDESAWVGPSTFTTACTTVTTLSENFSGSSTPNCWTNDGAESWLFSTDGGYGASSAGDHTTGGGTNYTWIDGSGGVGTNELLTPYVDVSGFTTPAFEFYYFSNNTDYPGDDNTLTVDFWDGAAWNNLLTYAGDNAAWQQGLYDLSGYTITGDVQFRFVVTETASISYYNDILVDDVSVLEYPSCLAPSDQTVTNITKTSAELGWTAGDGEIYWNIEYGESGFTQGSGTTVSLVDENPYTLGSLSSGTTYDWYVQADCDGAREESTWTGPNTFSTICDATASVPYFEDFDGVTAPAFPPCMTVENTNGDAEIWETDASGLSAPNCATIFYNEFLAMNDWFFTQGLDLTGGVTYEVSFAYGAGDYSEDLDVDWGTSPSSSTMSGSPIFSANSFSGDWYTGSGTFTPSSTGTYYIGFHGYSAANEFYIEVDDIAVVEAIVTTTWTGGTDSDWQNSGNWSDGIPSSGTDVTIPGGLTNYPTLLHTTSIGTLLVESGPGGDGSILNDGLLTVSGNATIQRYLTGGVWHDLSASTQGQTVNALYQGGNPDVWLRRYNETDNTRTYITELTDPLDPGAGFEVWVESGPRYDITVNYTGALQNSDITLNTSSTPALSYSGPEPLGYNLIGNPFASPIDLDLGSWNTTDVSTSFWVWNGITYLAYNTATSTGTLTDGIIPMGQGFFIQATSSSASITIPMDSRVHSSTGFYKISDSGDEDGITQMFLRATKGDVWDEMNITFNEEATLGFDDFDTRKLFSYAGKAPQLYSDHAGEKLTINGLPLELLTGKEFSVKVGYKAGLDGEQMLEANFVDFPETEVLLEDTRTGNIQSLVNNPVYEFNAYVEDNSDRFILYFNPIPTGIENPDSGDLIFVYAFNDNICIKSKGDAAREAKEVWIYDLFGRTVTHANAAASTFTTIPVNHLSGYVIVKIISDSGVKTSKVFIR